MNAMNKCCCVLLMNSNMQIGIFLLYKSSKFNVKLKCKIVKFNINANKVAKLHDTKK